MQLLSESPYVTVGLVTVAVIVILQYVFSYLSTKYRERQRRRKRYSHAVNKKEDCSPHETVTIRSLLAKDKLISRFPDRPTVATCYDNFRMTVEKHPDRPFLGTRADGQNEFEWITYSQAAERAKHLGSAMKQFGLKEGSLVGICAKNRAEWLILRQACSMYSMVVVHVYCNLGQDQLERIFEHSKLDILFSDKSEIEKVAEYAKDVPLIVSLDALGELMGRLHTQHPKCRFFSLKEFEKTGRSEIFDPVPPSPDTLATICYTSGTERSPKGVMINHANLIANAAGCDVAGILQLKGTDVHLSFLPLAHMFEQLMCLLMTTRGGRIGFCRDIQRLSADMKILRPTVLIAVPRLFSRLQNSLQHSINEYPFWKKFLFQTGYAAKKSRLLSTGAHTHFLWDLLVFGKIQQSLGGRVRYMVTGSAPSSPSALEFVRICFSCEIYEGYGLTECTTGCAATIPGRFVDTNLVPLPNTELKLRDIADQGYLVTDQPNPRGEILVRGPCVCQGYHNSPKETEELIDSDGWLCTSDVGELLPDGTFRIVDRKRSVFKLSQGEFVAPEWIEQKLRESEFVDAIFVYGNRFKSKLVCLIYPNKDQVLKWAATHDRGDKDFESLCLLEDLKKAVLVDLTDVARRNGLNSLETPKALYLVNSPFDEDSSLVTPTLKIRRGEMERKFQRHIEEMYTSLQE